MDGIKSPLQSVTITAAAGSAISGVVGLAGLHIDPTVITDGVNQICQLVSIGLALVALWGRFRATKKIGSVE